jgi:hypothetical protein
MVRTCVLILGISILLTSCSNNGRIFEDIEDICQGGVVRFNMNDVLLKDWDRGCYFDYGVSKREAEDILGVKIGGSPELVSRLIFLKGNVVVEYDEQSYTPSQSIQQRVVFKYDKKVHPGYFCFDKKNSVFNITREEIDGRVFYDLRKE